MQDQGNNSSGASGVNAAEAAKVAVGRAAQNDFIQKIVEKIKNSENILIALPKDPSVDGIAAAIGLTLFLDGMQKHATAIYSGRTPDELAFLQPSETFEKTTDSLQDFIISLNKEKADHLRYKLEGDYVKVFITPYKSKLTEEDLTFSHGDYNVDFVIAIDVKSAANLDGALREHGRIMHDASAVNITTGEPGRFGEIEWSNPTASSLCEMMTELIFVLQGSEEKPLDKDVATALLTGIVAATDRFSNNRTNSDTLSVASKLMAMGADQQLITANVRRNDIITNDGSKPLPKVTSVDKTKLAVEHEEDDVTVNPAARVAPSASSAGSPEPTAVGGTNSAKPESVIVKPVLPGVGDTLVLPGMTPGVQAVSQSGANPVVNTPVTTQASGATVPNPAQMVIPTPVVPSAPAASVANVGQMQLPNVPVNSAAGTSPAVRSMATSEPVVPEEKQVGTAIQPPVVEPQKPKNYAEMMEEALAEPMPGEVAQAPVAAQPNVAPASTMDILTAQPSAMPANNAVQPMAPAGGVSQPVGGVAQPTVEPVPNVAGPVLPPPPVPNVPDGMMPPVLPPVQMGGQGNF